MSCPRCGAVNPAGHRFCGQCAAPLDRAAPTGLAPPEAYTPRYLAERIRTSRAELEGERKHVTVLFADLKGSMELLAGRDPEDARRILDPILHQMMEAVHRYEGTVNQVMGDGIMALFGAPIAHEDHAVRACYAALRMQESVKQYGEDVRRREGILPQIRVGLNSGEVVVRSIASDLHVDYTAVGETTHLAARVEQAASPGSTLITGATLQLVEGYVGVSSLGAVKVKGRATPVDIYELAAAVTVRSRFQVLARRGLAKFVGRSAEMEHLTMALEQSLTGRGQTVAIVGEAGVGKSRLIWQFAHSPRTEGCLILETAAASYGRTTSYLSVSQLLREYFRLDGREESREAREKVGGKVLALDRALEPMLVALLALLDLPVEDPEWQALEPSERRQRTIDAVVRLLLRESQVRPLLLVVEDVHWADPETHAVLGRLAESSTNARVLLLVSVRSDCDEWGGRDHGRQLHLEPLPPTDSQQFLGVLLGGDSSLEGVKQLLVDRARGNPLFLEQTVRGLVETQALAGAPGAYRLTTPIQAIQVPVSVQSLLAARIDRLPPEDKRLLQAAAVIGHDVPFTLLQAVADEPDQDVRRGLADLQARGFVQEASLFPDLEYTFRHGLVQEVAYSALLQQHRRELHARIVAVIESLHADRQGECVERLAYHAMKGELWDKAATYSREAAVRAATRSAYRESMTSFEEALRALGRLPDSPAARARAIDLRLDSRVVLAPLGEYDRILQYMQEAEVLARELGDQRRLGLVLADMGARLRNVGEHRRALEASRQALAIAGELGEPDLQLEAKYRLAQAHFAVGDLGAATSMFEETAAAFAARVELAPPVSSVPRHRGALPGFFQAWPHAWLGLLLSHLGRFEQALQHAERAMQIAGRMNHPHTLIEAHAALGAVSLERGDLQEAERVFEQGIALLRRGSARDVNLLSGLGYVHALSGRLAEALPLLEEAVKGGPSISAMGSGLAVRMSRLADAYHWAGRIAEALRHASGAIELARKHHERVNEAIALRTVAEITAVSDATRAEGYYADSRVLAEELGMRPLAAHCHMGLGKLYRRAALPDGAREQLKAALREYRAMNMQWWPEHAEAEIRLV